MPSLDTLLSLTSCIFVKICQAPRCTIFAYIGTMGIVDGTDISKSLLTQCPAYRILFDQIIVWYHNSTASIVLDRATRYLSLRLAATILNTEIYTSCQYKPHNVILWASRPLAGANTTLLQLQTV